MTKICFRILAFSYVLVRMRKKPSCVSSCNKSLESTHQFWWNSDEYLNRIVQFYEFYRIFRIWEAANRKFDPPQDFCRADFDFIVLFYRYELYATFPRRFYIGCRWKNTDLRAITSICFLMIWNIQKKSNLSSSCCSYY